MTMAVDKAGLKEVLSAVYIKKKKTSMYKVS